MRVEVDLRVNVAHIEDRHVMPDKCQRRNERCEPSVVVVNDAEELAFFLGRQPSFEESNNVLKYIYVFPHRGFHGKRLHEELSIFHGQLFWMIAVGLTDEPSQRLIVRMAMREEQIFVHRVEL